ncbi:MAG: hypothetical protein JEY97_13320 [Bacteroidales bacterium]|nr:hypothetical protein [Bacteroidales bacterium]
MKITKFVLFILICMLSITQACKTSTTIRKQKKFEKAAEKKAKKDSKVYEAGVKRHLKMQKDETKQQMKQTKRKSKKHNKNKRVPFFRRIFGWIWPVNKCKN